VSDAEGLSIRAALPLSRLQGSLQGGSLSRFRSVCVPKKFCIAGLVGSGRTEILTAIFGADLADAGSVRVAGELIANPRPDRMIDAGVALIPEDRRTQGLILGMSVVDNISLVELARRWLFGVRNIEAEKSASRQLVDALSCGEPCDTRGDAERRKSTESGDREMTPGDALRFDVRRADARSRYRGEIEDPASRRKSGGAGMAILLVSSEHAELLQICDRIAVLREGRIAAEFEGEDATDEALTQASFGNLSERARGIESRAP
jgi:ABC-type branched-subunit amino acid transport system ATPase component